MNISVQKIALAELELPQESSSLCAQNYWPILGSLPVECQVRLGSLELSLEQLQSLKEGEIFRLDQKTNESIDILINNHVVARGELLAADESFAIRISEILS